MVSLFPDVIVHIASVALHLPQNSPSIINLFAIGMRDVTFKLELVISTDKCFPS